MPINERLGQSSIKSFTGCFEATGIAPLFSVGSIDFAIGLFYSDFLPVIAKSQPAKVQIGVDRNEAGSTLILRSRKDKHVLNGGYVTHAATGVVDTGRRIHREVQKSLINSLVTTKEEGCGLSPMKPARA